MNEKEEIETLQNRLHLSIHRNATYTQHILEMHNRIKELETVIDEYLNSDDQPTVINKLKSVRLFTKWEVNL